MLRGIASVIVSFMLCIAVAVLTVTIVCGTTIINRNFAGHIMNKSNYVGILQEEVIVEIASLVQVAGFDAALADKIVNSLILREDVEIYIDRIYEDKEAVLDFTERKRSFYEIMAEDARSEGIVVDEQVEADMMYTAEQAVLIYESAIRIPQTQGLRNAVAAMRRYWWTIMAGSVAWIALMTMALIWIRRSGRNRIRYIIYGVSGAFLLVLVPPFALRLSGIVERVGLNLESIYTYFVTYIYSVIDIFYIAAGVLLLIAMVLGQWRRLQAQQYSL